jgi:excisionase family DNA binding protein
MRNDIKQQLRTELSVSLWPTAAQALGIGRNTAYKAAAKGEIPGVYRIGDKIRVATAPLRTRLGLEGREAA